VRIGVLGGTFDPIHLGHLAAARAALDCAQLDSVILVPTGDPPHRGHTIATAEQRLAMTRLAAGNEPALEVSDVEVKRPGASYTVDTLRELRRQRPADVLSLILGWDAARLFSTWRMPDEVQRLADVVVVTRPGTTAPDARALRGAGFDPARVVLCERATPDISGSALRRALARGDRVRDELPPAVERYIANHGLYRHNQSVGC